ncbi:hypothetical protein PCANC_07675 [Puccinia coronata f. sp. avenae]|uniref:HAT C-terminal dimerisation domain-containing protein n=1 Tax=Puccinia coronata f. sp. avenae TaxID=200324 RepID=A0A2N5T2M6_9BASI|nr:hypothetical protein PCANC_07675 [Puccinia coronata f. sp. avenae]
METNINRETKQIGTLGFLQVQHPFDNNVLNQLIVMWQIRQALPWSRIKDPILRAAFAYSNKKAFLYGRRWSADKAKVLYSMLKSNVFKELNDLQTKFTLVHDVWTTKGNRFAFIGAAVAYIDDNWKYVVRNLALKMLPWRHTMDSGSNNNTMAASLYNLIHRNNINKDHIESGTADLEESGWDPKTRHVWCFCHKIALVVNAGLKALSLQTLPPGKMKESVLGFFPVLGKLIEEDKPKDGKQINLAGKTAPHLEDYNAGSKSDYGNTNEEVQGNPSYSDNNSDDPDPTTQPTPSAKHAPTERLRELTQKLDVVIKQITRSAAQHAHFQRTAEKLNIKVAPLIAGYGIRWNIKYQSYQKAIDAREVIDHILKHDHQQNQTGGGLFDDVHFLPWDWKEIDNLNAELEVFVKLTLQMEAKVKDGVEGYLSAKLKFTDAEINDKDTPLMWWKANQKPFPILAVMACAYLGTPGSSCAVERLFSTAADVSGTNRCCLLPSTLPHCVSSLMWLQEEVPLTGDFAKAGKVLNSLGKAAKIKK